MRRGYGNVRSLMASRVPGTQNRARGRSRRGLRISRGPDDSADPRVSDRLQRQRDATVYMGRGRRAERIVAMIGRSLERLSGGLLDLEDLVDRAAGEGGKANEDFGAAQQLIRAANLQIARLRGRLVAFRRDALPAETDRLRVAGENTTAAERARDDAGFAGQAGELTRGRILAVSSASGPRLFAPASRSRTAKSIGASDKRRRRGSRRMGTP